MDANQSRIIENLPEDEFIPMKVPRARTKLQPWTMQASLDESCIKGLVERKEMRNRGEGFKLKFSKEYYRQDLLTMEDRPNPGSSSASAPGAPMPWWRIL